MKKFAIILSLFCLFIFIGGCGNGAPTLDKNVSELRSDVFYGESESLTLKAGYGFREDPYVNDGAVGQTVSTLNFRLLGKETDGVTYTLSFSHNGEVYNSEFKLNPVTHSLTATIEIDEFDLKEFDVNVSSSSNSESVKLTSLLPEGTLTSSEALKHLQQNQSELLANYSDADGNFNAELYMRVIVKEEKPFWYVGIASGNEQLKALLVDGLSGEVLAIREIF